MVTGCGKKQVIEHLQADLPGEAEINEIEVSLARIIAEEEGAREETLSRRNLGF
jgi:hypothetical protein